MENDMALLQFLRSKNTERFTKLDAFCYLIGKMSGQDKAHKAILQKIFHHFVMVNSQVQSRSLPMIGIGTALRYAHSSMDWKALVSSSENSKGVTIPSYCAPTPVFLFQSSLTTQCLKLLTFFSNTGTNTICLLSSWLLILKHTTEL